MAERGREGGGREGRRERERKKETERQRDRERERVRGSEREIPFQTQYGLYISHPAKKSHKQTLIYIPAFSDCSALHIEPGSLPEPLDSGPTSEVVGTATTSAAEEIKEGC